MLKPWYQEGLRFQCSRCGNCCTGAPGTVRVTEQEIEDLAGFLALKESHFRKLYTRPLTDGATSLKEKPGGDCVFWAQKGGCTVYRQRPRQCRTWPFWSSVVESPEAWEEEKVDCPGMGEGPVFDVEHIERTSADDGTSSAVEAEGSESPAKPGQLS